MKLPSASDGARKRKKGAKTVYAVSAPFRFYSLSGYRPSGRVACCMSFLLLQELVRHAFHAEQIHTFGQTCHAELAAVPFLLAFHNGTCCVVNHNGNCFCKAFDADALAIVIELEARLLNLNSLTP